MTHLLLQIPTRPAIGQRRRQLFEASQDERNWESWISPSTHSKSEKGSWNQRVRLQQWWIEAQPEGETCNNL
ncbi:hypothetical protein B9Z55_018275 [Caenorhabditis nigoni]|uniref:Uncharacterized protein n=1 Tax=Caenorhabditis nigoni TaxID=1611254 RepID=A0A2G5TDE2_9PELO|nr:hypothetical protein B9Z55_018275 [Caenorhabditis nigoni]